MLKKTIKHNDLDGNPTETVAYFNLTKAEAIEINIRNDLEAIGQSRNNNEIMDTFKRILQASYGKRTGSGEFIKEGFPAFSASEAYSELFMEIWSKPEYAQEFIQGLLPAGITLEAKQTSQSAVPEHLRDHPSMQSHLKPQQTPREKLPNFDTTPAVQPPAIATDSEYQAFLAYKAAQEAATTTANSTVSDDLI